MNLPVLATILAVVGIAATMVAVALMEKDIAATKAAIKPRNRSRQYIYFYNGRGENPFHVKIGRSNNYIQRLRNQKTARPYGLNVLGVVSVKDCEGAERFLHWKFRENCIDREWFHLTPRIYFTIMAIRDEKLTHHARENL